VAGRYQRLGWFTQHVSNPAVALLTRAGVSVAGSRVLEVRGRKFGVRAVDRDGNRIPVSFPLPG
jgi:hypothetical protein